MKISIIIPCYNEEKTILRILDKIKENSNFEKEIIIADDNSFDNTKEILEKINYEKYSIKKIIFHKINQGKGSAIKSCISHIDSDITIIQDADLEYDPENYINLLKPIYDNNADVVYGSRFIGGNEKRVIYFWHMVGNKFLTLLSNMLTNLNLSDMETGYKVFRSKILKKLDLKENRFGFEPEITAKISKLDVKIYEVGISYRGRSYLEGKKITWKDGFSAIRCIIKYNLFYNFLK